MTVHLEANFGVSAAIHNEDFEYIVDDELEGLFETDDSIQIILTQVLDFYAWIKIKYYKHHNRPNEYFCILKDSFFEWYEGRYGERHEDDERIKTKVNWQQEGF